MSTVPVGIIETGFNDNIGNTIPVERSAEHMVGNCICICDHRIRSIGINGRKSGLECCRHRSERRVTHADGKVGKVQSSGYGTKPKTDACNISCTETGGRHFGCGNQILVLVAPIGSIVWIRFARGCGRRCSELPGKRTACKRC